MDLRLPDALAAKAARFPESSYGATTVTLVLVDGRLVPQVILGGDEIVKVGGRTITTPAQLGFSLADIRDVLPERVGCFAAALLAGRRLTRAWSRQAGD
jgi:hypothetical protein